MQFHMPSRPCLWEGKCVWARSICCEWHCWFLTCAMTDQSDKKRPSKKGKSALSLVPSWTQRGLWKAQAFHGDGILYFEGMMACLMATLIGKEDLHWGGFWILSIDEWSSSWNALGNSPNQKKFLIFNGVESAICRKKKESLTKYLYCQCKLCFI